MTDDWFKRLKEHKKEAMKVLVPMIVKLKETEKEICKSCLYREATHQFGCMECCPLIHAKEEAKKQINELKKND